MQIFKEGVWVALGQVSSIIGSFILLRVLTESMSANEYGNLALGLTIAGLGSQLILGGIIAGIGRYYSIAAAENELKSYLSAAAALVSYASVAIIVSGSIIVFIINYLQYGAYDNLIVAATFLSVTNGVNSSLINIENAARRRASAVLFSSIDAWMKPIIVSFIALICGLTSERVIYCYIISSVFTGAIQIYKCKNEFNLDCDTNSEYKEWLRKLWRYSLPFAMWGGFTWLQLFSDRWALNAFGNSGDVAQYAVLYQIGYTPTALIAGIVMSIFEPVLYQRWGDGSDSIRSAQVHQMGWLLSNSAIGCTLIIFFVTSVFHDFIYHNLVAKQYQEYSYLLPWIVMAGGFFSAGQMLGIKLMSEMKTSKIATVKIATAIIGLFLNIAGAYFAGVKGVVLSLLLFSVMYYFWMGWISKIVDAKKMYLY